jgi:hypothetical protein
VGAAEGIRTKIIDGIRTSMHAASFEGHLHVEKWLFEVGAAENIKSKKICGWIQLRYVSIGSLLRRAMPKMPLPI